MTHDLHQHHADTIFRRCRYLSSSTDVAFPVQLSAVGTWDQYMPVLHQGKLQCLHAHTKEATYPRAHWFLPVVYITLTWGAGTPGAMEALWRLSVVATKGRQHARAWQTPEGHGQASPELTGSICPRCGFHACLTMREL